MNNIYLKFKKIKKALSNLYNIDDRIKINNLITDYESSILNSKEKVFFNYNENKKNQLIVSLTTYSKRIYDVHLTVESLFRQTLKPNKIILWLAEDEFNKENIPYILKKMEEKGLEIGYYKDIKSYKKLIPTLEKYPDNIIITVDDDILYPYDFIENLYREYNKNQKCVYFYRGHKIKLDKNSNLLPYNQWERDYQGEEDSLTTVPTGIGGILYPPKCFYKDITREDLFMKLAPKADDIWFKAMTLMNNIPCKKIKLSKNFKKKFIDLEDAQDIALGISNIIENQNDIQLKAIFDYYNLWEKLKNEE